jgi:hypothetical protein
MDRKKKMNNAITLFGLCAVFFAALLVWVIMEMPMPVNASEQMSKQGGITVEFVDRYGDYDGYGVVR